MPGRHKTAVTRAEKVMTETHEHALTKYGPMALQGFEGLKRYLQCFAQALFEEIGAEDEWRP